MSAMTEATTGFDRCVCGHYAEEHELALDGVSYVCIVPGCECEQFTEKEESDVS